MAPRVQEAAGMCENTAVKIKKQRHWAARIRERLKQASAQKQARSRSQPKTRHKPADEHVTEIAGAEKIRFWTANPGVYEAAAMCAEE